MARSFGLSDNEGVLIADVQKDGPADKAGARSGDVIIELNGNKVKDSVGFRRDVARILPNKEANLVVFRDGKSKKLTLTVAAYPDQDEETGGSAKEAVSSVEKLGFEVQELTQDLAQRFDYEAGLGVIISEVYPGSKAEEAGLRPGMLILEVNRSAVNSVKQFEQAVKKGKGESVLLRVKTEQGSFFKQLRLTD